MVLRIKDPVIRVRDVAYVRFQAPDLDRMEKFLLDFGMRRAARTDTALYMRGMGPDHHVHVTELGEPGFAGLAFNAASRDDLDRIAAVEEAGEVEAMDEPGGGMRVCLADPDGFRVEVIHGQRTHAPLEPPSHGPFNSLRGYARLNAPHETPQGPAPVVRLGHCVLNVADFAASEAWYKERFGFITSDEIHAGGKGQGVGAFMRCDAGGDHVDHHTLFLLGGGKAEFNHAAFEAPDFDAIMAGHEHLRKAGYKHAWGVGRHIMGSQIYDYWQDPWEHTVEHWTDGDLLDNTSPARHFPLEKLLDSQWSAMLPPGA